MLTGRSSNHRQHSEERQSFGSYALPGVLPLFPTPVLWERLGSIGLKTTKVFQCQTFMKPLPKQ